MIVMLIVKNIRPKLSHSDSLSVIDFNKIRMPNYFEDIVYVFCQAFLCTKTVL